MNRDKQLMGLSLSMSPLASFMKICFAGDHNCVHHRDEKKGLFSLISPGESMT